MLKKVSNQEEQMGQNHKKQGINRNEASITPKNTEKLNELINYRDKIWGSILTIFVFTFGFMFLATGWIKLFIAISGILAFLGLFFKYRIKNKQISSCIDDMFTAN